MLVVHAFCLMPNHYHLLCSTPRGELARWMRHVNGDYVRWFNHRYRRVGHLWQGRYKAILVENAAYMRECSRYIHLNPNRAKLTRPAERYRWSSYRNYVGGPQAVPWIETAQVLGEFGGDRKEYRAFIEAGKGQKPVNPFERAVAGLILGGEAFVARVREMAAGKPDRGEQPALKVLAKSGLATPERIEQAVADVFAEEGPARRRSLLLYAQRAHSGLRPTEIARRYGRTHAAVAMASKRMLAEARTNRSLAEGMARLEERIASEK